MTKEVVLTTGSIAFVDDEDFDRVTAVGRWYEIRGGQRRYACRSFTNIGRKIYMHRFILQYEGTDVIDHVDGNGLNNRRENIRIVSQTVNNFNKKILNSNNTSGVRGVTYCTRRNVWRSHIKAFGKPYSLGEFKTKEEAVVARLLAEQRLAAGLPPRATDKALLTRAIELPDDSFDINPYAEDTL